MVLRYDDHEESLFGSDSANSGAIHVRVPLASRAVLRDVARALRRLADTIETQGTLKGISELGALVRVKFEVRHVNNLIATACAQHGIERASTKGTDPVPSHCDCR